MNNTETFFEPICKKHLQVQLIQLLKIRRDALEEEERYEYYSNLWNIYQSKCEE